MDSPAHDELLRLKQEALDASARLDGEFFDNYLADDARAITPAGVATKSAVVQAAGAGGFRSIAVGDAQVDLLCGDVGIVTYQATFARPDGTTVDVITTTLYRRDDMGVWKGILYQQTPLARPSAS